MATSLATRASPNQSLSLLRLSFNFLHSFSTSASPASASTSAPASNKPKRRKKKNLFEVAQFLPNWGIGMVSMEKLGELLIKMGIIAQSTVWNSLGYGGRHQNIYGLLLLNWDEGEVLVCGLPIADGPKKISGVHKRCWRYIPSLIKSAENTPKLTTPTENAATADVQAA
ncbi:hypothetical protein Patl1_31204 [Pistacia atlantica]|uniref:Uncharacterized protein n=1 Tax=Pistacia atlantica TaxID=434234 RepID=A0ACC1AB69_9ROSI|nr:hypothetical protein Patl1_31204 [Pistacia atlantica]